jgi:hypothetical protein
MNTLRSPQALNALAARVCDAAERVLGKAFSPVRGADWDPVDEDALLETAHWTEQYRRWETTGDHGFTGLRPGLQPQAALGDQLATALGSLMRYSNLYGLNLDQPLRDEVDDLLAAYVQQRQREGGPGSLNPETWR